MKTRGFGWVVLGVFVLATNGRADVTMAPADPQATLEARALLDFFYRISGNHIFSGQHNYPNVKERNLQFAARYIGKTPVVFSTDWGFAIDGNTDSYLARPDIVETAIRQHRQGGIVTICWHAVPPTADEPVTFRPLPDSNPGQLASVQGRLLDKQFQDCLTPGTELHKRWEAQVDEIAKYLLQLQDAKVPVLWRPYHEMNGDWFWWGGRAGEFSTRRLYQQLFDRLVHHHQLHNLVWVWSVDRPHNEAMAFEKYYPVSEYLDILALDVYGNDFSQSYYDGLVRLSGGKPLVLGEVGNPPSPKILDEQPRWAYFVVWAGMARNTSAAQYEALTQDDRVLWREDKTYADLAAPYWQACGIVPEAAPSARPDFSGLWVLDDESSSFDARGRGFAPSRIEVRHAGNDFTLIRSRDTEWGEWNSTEDALTLDGAEHESTRFNAPIVTTAKASDDGSTIEIESIVTFGEQAFHSREVLHCEDEGQKLIIDLSAKSPRGNRHDKLVFRRWQ